MKIDETEAAVSRRSLFNRAGLVAGSALVGSVLHSRMAQAQDAGTGASNQPLAPGDAMMNPPAMNPTTPNTPPADAMIAQITSPGRNEENDVAILNYALTLEFLEAEFYTRVVQADEARPFLRGRPKDIARILARDENTHVETVRDAVQKLGGTPVAKPNFQFPAEAFISQVAFLSLSATLEETGVSAYLGQGANVRRKDVLNLAASIYGNEARHTSLIRYLLGDNFAPRDRELPLPMDAVLKRIQPFIVS